MEGHGHGNIVAIRVICLVLHIEVPGDWLSHHAKIFLKPLSVGWKRSEGGGVRYERAEIERNRFYRGTGDRGEAPQMCLLHLQIPNFSGLTLSLLSSPSPPLQATRDAHTRQCRGPGPSIHGLHTHLLLPGGLLPQGWL